MGGVLSSMLLTLVVVPIVYTLLEDILGWVRAIPRLPQRLARRRVEAPAASVDARTPVVTPPMPADDDEA